MIERAFVAAEIRLSLSDKLVQFALSYGFTQGDHHANLPYGCSYVL